MSVAFHDFPANAFPIRIYAYRQDQEADTDPVWFVHVTEPGAIRVPGIDETGFPVRIVVTFADGTEERT